MCVSDQEQERLRFSRFVTSYYYDIIKFLDTKASIVLALDGILLTIMASKNFHGLRLSTFFALEAALMLLLSAGFSVLAVKPRSIKGAPLTRLNFESPLTQDRDELKGSFIEIGVNEQMSDYVDTVYVLAKIIRPKRISLFASLIFLFSGLVLIVLTITLS
jgi:hypothetical protein